MQCSDTVTGSFGDMLQGNETWGVSKTHESNMVSEQLQHIADILVT